MAQKEYKDDWGTGAREGYEDRGSFRPPRARAKEPGNPILRTLGGIAIVAGICWGVYLVTSSADHVAALQQNHGPIAIVALGAVALVLGKYLRA
jgi:UDP-N-acetylmuramyl pentapeptide phosphotransferase/UDP-N-acetylglucosamine-1-phosphate transferase